MKWRLDGIDIGRSAHATRMVSATVVASATEAIHRAVVTRDETARARAAVVRAPHREAEPPEDVALL